VLKRGGLIYGREALRHDGVSGSWRGVLATVFKTGRYTDKKVSAVLR